MNLFHYEPLDRNSNQIRLLRFSDQLNSQRGYVLDSFDLNECPLYEALSYTWEPPLPTSIITLNKESFEIRQNLADFLVHFRIGITLLDENDSPLYHPKYLWIDQLCINQSSEQEKTHQVKRMAEIYKQAQRVVAWLGPCGEQSYRGMRLIADNRFVGKLPNDNYPSTFSGINLWRAMDKEQQEYLNRLLKNRRSVENMLRKPYRDRLWIVQEFVLARDIVFACGPFAVTLAAIWTLRFISDVPRWFKSCGRQVGFVSIPEPVRNVLHERIPRIYKTTFSSPEARLYKLLADFSTRKCGGPRDKVYGLLALCQGKVDIIIDYSKPADVIFCELSTPLSSFKGCREKWLLQLARDMGVK
ncbi:heterokaryon incompatibility protein-domain-containing protein [Bipolaris maydis]|nr:heterokaryon incompatibility protein-domain-containing protein [Bipolaris maydis]